MRVIYKHKTKVIKGVVYKLCTSVNGCNKWKPMEQNFRKKSYPNSEGEYSYEHICRDCRLKHNKLRHKLKAMRETVKQKKEKPPETYNLMPMDFWPSISNKNIITGMFGYGRKTIRQ